MERRRRRPARVANAVDVRRVEVEYGAGRVLPRQLANPASGVPLEVVLVEHALAHVHRARRDVVIVVARVLRVEPADQPEVEVGIAVQLDEVAGTRVVPDEALPEPRLRGELRDEVDQRGPVEIAVLRNPAVDPASQAFHPRRRDGFRFQRASSTASPKPRTTSSPCAGSSHGASLPKRT